MTQQPEPRVSRELIFDDATTEGKTYTTEVACCNCGFEGVGEFPCGITVSTNPCPNCHCKYMLRSRNKVAIADQARYEANKSNRDFSSMGFDYTLKALDNVSEGLLRPSSLTTGEFLRLTTNYPPEAAASSADASATYNTTASTAARVTALRQMLSDHPPNVPTPVDEHL